MSFKTEFRQSHHPVDHKLSPSRPQPVDMPRPAMAAARKADDVHAGGSRGLNAGDRILDDEAVVGRDAHPRCRMQEQIRRGLSARDFAGAEDVLEQVVEPGQAQREGDPLRQRGGGDAAAMGQGEDRVADAGDRLQLASRSARRGCGSGCRRNRPASVQPRSALDPRHHVLQAHAHELADDLVARVGDAERRSGGPRRPGRQAPRNRPGRRRNRK